MSRNSRRLSERCAIADILCPDNGYRGKMERLGIKQKDFIKENTRDIRHLQQKIKHDKIEDIKLNEPKELYKMEQFKNVSSKLFSYENDENSINQKNVNVEFLTKGISEMRREKIRIQNKLERQQLETKFQDSPQSPRKPALPHGTAKLKPRRNSDFIRLNLTEVLKMSPPKHEMIEEPFKHEDFGRLPKYLEQMKAKSHALKEEARQRATDPDCPKGMKLMPDDERLKTLDILIGNKEEIMKQYGKLPFVVETPSMLKRRAALEEKLKEIEHAIQLFSKPRVYV